MYMSMSSMRRVAPIFLQGRIYAASFIRKTMVHETSVWWLQHKALCDKAQTDLSIAEQNRQRALKYLRRENVTPSQLIQGNTNAVLTDEEVTTEDSVVISDTGDITVDAIEDTHEQGRKIGAKVMAEQRVRKYIPQVTGEMPDMTTLQKMMEVEHGARDVVVLDVRDTASFANWMVVATGLSVPHVIAIADGVQKDMRAAGVRVGKGDVNVCGRDAGDWVAVDVGSVVVHVMTEEVRLHYNLERLWGTELNESGQKEEDRDALDRDELHREERP